MNRRIRKVAVLGSGLMGSGIACHLAGAGIEVLMLDIVPFDLTDDQKKDPRQRNRIVQAAFDTALKSKPTPIYDKAFAGETVKVTKEYFGVKYSISYNPLRSNSGEVIGVSIFAHDETELVALKEQLAGRQPIHGNWNLTEEMEKTFRIQLEALKITQDELRPR